MIPDSKFSITETIDTIRQLQTLTLNNKFDQTQIAYLQSQAEAIQAAVRKTFSQQNTETQQQLAVDIYPIALEAKAAFKTLKQSNSLLKDCLLEWTHSIVQSFDSLSKGIPLKETKTDINNNNNNNNENDEFFLLENPKFEEDIEIKPPQKWIVDHSDRYKASLQNVTFIHPTVVIPSKLVSESRSDCLIQKKCTNDELADEHIAFAPNIRAQPVKRSKKAPEWKALRCEKTENNQMISEGEVTSTTHPLRKEHKIPHNLTNIHYQEVDGQLCISCGVINSLKKANELLSVIKKLKGDQPVRIVINQLNSFYNEPELVSSEHASSLHLNKELDPKLQNSVVHLNHCMSAFSNLPSSYEDGLSYQQNLLGLASLCQWAGIKTNDISKEMTLVSAWRKDRHRLQETLNQVGKLKQTEALNKEITDLKKQLYECEQNLTECEKRLTVSLQNASISCKNQSSELHEKDLRKSMILKILGIMLEQETYGAGYNKSLGRVNEVELNLILSMLMKDVVVVINCKSGLDRTGFIKSVWEGLSQMKKKYMAENLTEEQALEETLNLVLDMDKHSLELDTLCYDVAKRHPEDITTDLNKPKDSLKGQEVLNDLVQALDKHPNPLLKEVWFYKQRIIKSMFRVALPATIESTGVAGLKYGHNKNYGANPHPFWRLPAFISTDDGKVIQLYTAGGMLYYHWPTEAGKQLLLRNSRCRGD